MVQVVVGLFINVETGQILLAKRHHFSSLAGYWELPGGVMEAGEDVQGCLERQMFQSFNVNIQALNPFYELQTAYDGQHYQFTALFAKLLDSELQPQIHEAVQWVGLDAWLDLELVSATREIGEKLLDAIA